MQQTINSGTPTTPTTPTRVIMQSSVQEPGQWVEVVLPMPTNPARVAYNQSIGRLASE
jgi:hypothetical protein